MKHIVFFDSLGIKDIAQVGGKNASLGEMYNNISSLNIKVPNGFATTADAYRYFLESNDFTEYIKKMLDELEPTTQSVHIVSKKIRELIESGTLPSDFSTELEKAYTQLSSFYETTDVAVAIRSSATAEDLPTASFAGQQESFLNVTGIENVESHIIRCFSSLFTPRAIFYRIEKGFDHLSIALSAGVQKMVVARSAGVAFTLDPDTGFDKVVMINSNWGLGETVVKGSVNPDIFYTYKPLLEKDFPSLIRKTLGSKQQQLITEGNQTKLIDNKQTANCFSLTNDEALTLSHQCIKIEDRYSSLYEKKTAMDIEWAIDENDELFIVQARPETVHSQKDPLQRLLKQYTIQENKEELQSSLITTGKRIGQQVVTGVAKVVTHLDQITSINENDILVTHMTDPDWVPIMKKVKGIVTDSGGRTCHAAIISRELGIPAIVGTQNGTHSIKDGDTITLDCSSGSIGNIYEGTVPFTEQMVKLNSHKDTDSILLNISDPESAFGYANLPAGGVGLARLEFIFAQQIKVHPMALLFPAKVSPEDQERIAQVTQGYDSHEDYFINVLAQEVATIAASFYPKQVVVRFSDLKSNEYRNLIGGSVFEPQEENPMLGLRGASRYYNELYEPAFRLECKALKKAREVLGFSNIKLLVPFVRTTEEAEKVIQILNEEGLSSNENLEILMMIEIPSNMLLLSEFESFFDGFSIGSNDLTQFTLAVDRDSSLVSDIYNEQNPAVQKCYEFILNRATKPVGFCGQAVSDFPELRKWLVDKEISTVSMTPAAFIEFLQKN